MRPLLLAFALSVAAAPLAAVAACDSGQPASPIVGSGSGDPTGVREAGAPPGDAQSDAVVPRGDRVLAIGTHARSQSYPSDVRTVLDAGAAYTTVAFAWDEIEAPYDAGAPDGAPETLVYEPTLHVSGLVLPGVGAAALLSLDALDESGPRFPVDLEARAIDDPELIARFTRAQEYALGQTAELDIAAYFVASSVDTALGDAPSGYAAFTRFFAQVAANARAARPGLKVGFSVSAAALASHAAELRPAWASADVAAVTLSRALGSIELPRRPPEDLAMEIDRAGGSAPTGKPLYVLGAAYPSGSAAGSDAASQATFVRAAFAAWDRQASRIPVLAFARLDDPSEARVRAEAARLGRDDAAFLDALRTIGLRDEGGRPKPALGAVVEQARARGF